MPVTPKMYGVSRTTPQVITGPKTPVKPASPTPIRTTTTAPQAMAKSMGPKYYAEGGEAEDNQYMSRLVKPAEKKQDNMYKKGGKVSSASSRADGISQRGKTKGTMIMCGGGYTKGK